MSASKTARAVAGGAALSLAFLGAAGCGPSKTAGSDEVTIVVQGDRRELELQEKSIKDREAALRDEQEKLDRRRLELDKVRVAADAEQSRRIEDEMLKLRAQQGEVAVKLSATEAQKTEVAARRTALEAPVAQLALSELSAREAGVAAREARLAERELDLARREKEVALREKDVGTRQDRVSQQEQTNTAEAQHLDRALREVPKPSVIEARHKKLLEELDARGVLVADLPLEDQPLNAEIWSARRQGDFVRAADLLAELSNAVKHLKVDQRFVEQKMVRLQGVRAGARLAERQRAEVERLLREVTGAYSDSKYEVANKGLNRIAAILDAGGSPG